MVLGMEDNKVVARSDNLSLKYFCYSHPQLLDEKSELFIYLYLNSIEQIRTCEKLWKFITATIWMKKGNSIHEHQGKKHVSDQNITKHL